ncbi:MULTISPECIES: GNAT family N-acetyltransferase [unclassified Exiguobacterium]|uniref:GNAT family N-acetyltransferase n=1 Tax=unclassified Exiguobacterium TaxID=2644629 RepID=UPI001BE8577D|nr:MULTISPECIES: GNAT family N-acetyltransferase [unclassified Exiguobacterium]
MYKILKDSHAELLLDENPLLRERFEDLGWAEHDALRIFLEVDGTIIGCADVTDDGASIEIHWLTILPEFRRRGRGRLFLDALAKESGRTARFFGDSLPESARFWKALGASFSESDEKEIQANQFSGNLLSFELTL